MSLFANFGAIWRNLFGDLIKFLNLARINFGERDRFFGEYFSGKRMKKGFLGELEARVKENLIWRELILANNGL